MIIDRECEFDKWSVCCTTQLADADNYYTKKQVDNIVIEAGAVTPDIVSGMIDSAISGKADIDDVYTDAEVDALLAGKANIADIPTKVSDLDNDLAFVSLEVSNNKLIFKSLNNNG